ncbi:MAG TPA: fatty acid desaturase [Pseudonocardia sp.]|jgi:alkane 1-monooxygenase|nr:fatty acid desaturase [Pseudonocardia sp.]
MKTYELTKPVDGQNTWRDGKRYLWMVGLVVPMLPFIAMGLHMLTGLEATLWFGPFMLLGVVPALDLMSGTDPTNPPDEVMGALDRDRYYQWVLYAYIPIQYAGFVVAFWYIATQDISILGKIGLALSVGASTGIAINTAHELAHKKPNIERWLSRVTLAPTAYGHFYIEHTRGHHVRVSTPEDPASARMGETFWAFWPRTVVGSFQSAWRLEAKRYSRHNTHPFHLRNAVLNAWVMTIVLWGAMIAWLGVGILPYLFVQAIYGYWILEVVNYMEHYGMLRQKVGPADRRRYERVLPEHSWNANNVVTNVLLYHLQRHSDHHANPTRRYQTLRDFPEAPVLPTGYTGMMVAALFPPLFRKLMDQRVVDHYKGDLRLANLQPSKREKLLKKYPPPADAAPLDENGVRPDTSAQKVADTVQAARCPGCEYTYNVAEGNELEGFAAGTPWTEIPDNWTCPDCGVREKVDFVPLDTAGV